LGEGGRGGRQAERDGEQAAGEGGTHVTGTFFASGSSLAMAGLAIGKVSKPSSERRAQKSEDRVSEPRSGLSFSNSWPEIVCEIFVSVFERVDHRLGFAVLAKCVSQSWGNDSQGMGNKPARPHTILTQSSYNSLDHLS
jgi:hypothetical protein